MASIPGTIVAAQITTGDTTTTYPTALSAEILGGWKAAANSTVRLAIPTARLEAGCVCWQVDTSTLYQWTGSAWTALALGGGGPPTGSAGGDLGGTYPNPTITLTGDVTKSGGSTATTIASNAVTNAKAAQMAANTIKGNNTGSTANAADLTPVQARSAIASDSGSASQFFRGDATFAALTQANLPVIGASLGLTVHSRAISNNSSQSSFAVDTTRGRVAALCYSGSTTTSGIDLLDPWGLGRYATQTLSFLNSQGAIAYDSVNDQYIVVTPASGGSSCSFYLVNPTSLAVSSTLNNSDGIGTALAIDPSVGFWYTSDIGAVKIVKVNSTTGATSVLSPSSGSSFNKTIINTSAQLLYTVHADGKVRRTVISTLSTVFGGVASSALSGVDSSSHICFDGSGNIWVTASSGGSIYVLNPSTLSTSATIAIPDFVNAMGGMAYNQNNQTMYVYAYGSSRLLAIDSVALSARLSFSTSGGIGQTIGYFPSNNRVFIETTSGTAVWQA